MHGVYTRPCPLLAGSYILIIQIAAQPEASQSVYERLQIKRLDDIRLCLSHIRL